MKCSVKDCEREAKTKSFCLMHYIRMYRHGTVEKPKCRSDILLEKKLLYCPGCEQEKHISNFNNDSSTNTGKGRYCKTCNRRKGKNNYKNHKDRHRNYVLKKKFGITLKEYNDALSEQNGRCAICGRLLTNKNIALDYNHSTKKIRGFLCHNCNFGLGHFNDDPSLLEIAKQYLIVNGPLMNEKMNEKEQS